MTEPKKNKPAELTEGQLNDVSGGSTNSLNDIVFIQVELEPREDKAVPLPAIQPGQFHA